MKFACPWRHIVVVVSSATTIMPAFFCRQSAHGFSLPVSKRRFFRHHHHHVSTSAAGRTLLRVQEINSDGSSDQKKTEMANRLLGSVISRARSTLVNTSTTGSDSSSVDSSTASSAQQDKVSIHDLLDSAVGRAEAISGVGGSSVGTENDSSAPPKETKKKGKDTMPKLNYRGNPAITNTALAQSLWSSILRPHVDTAIDATCGN
jgi:hypothetical protein